MAILGLSVFLCIVTRKMRNMINALAFSIAKTATKNVFSTSFHEKNPPMISKKKVALYTHWGFE